jgi:steroid delta-isomerase-like uncharacterized protein
MSKEEVQKIDAQGMAAWDRHDPDLFVSQLADNFVWHDWTLPEPMRSKEAAKAYFSAWITAFPDMKVKQVSRVVSDDAVAAEIEFSGTNNGPMNMAGNQIPPTNKSAVGRGTYMARIQGGKIVEFRTHPDVAGLMMQLGFMPQM